MNVRFIKSDVIKSLYKAGMPEGNIFDFTSSRILKFEHKWNTEQKKKAIVEKYKHMGLDERGALERSVARSERSMSAKTVKSAISVKSAKKEKGGKEEPAKDSSKSKPKKK